MTTKLWIVFNRLGWVNVEIDADMLAYWKYTEHLRSPEPISELYIDTIQSIATAYDTQFLLAIIPHMDSLQVDFETTCSSVFKHTPYHYPHQILYEDYKYGNGHFNDKGHEKYADFLDKLIDSTVHASTKEDTIF